MINRPSITKEHSFTGHKDAIYALCGLNEHEFVSGGADGHIIKWDTNGYAAGKVVAKVSTSVYALSYDPSRDHLFIGQNFDGLHVIDPVAKQEITSLQMTRTHIFDIQFDDDFLYIATGDGAIYIVSRESWKLVKMLNLSQKSARTLQIDEHRIYAGYSDGCIRVIDKKNYKLIQEIQAHKNSVFSLCIDPTNKMILSGSRDAHLKIWSLEDGNTLFLTEDIVAHMYTINNISYHSNGLYFITCSMDKSIKIWDSGTFKLIRIIDKGRYAGHGTSVNKLLSMPNKNSLISCSDDRTISVWDINFSK